MEAYKHIPLRLDGTIDTAASNYPQWVYKTYRKGDRVYNGGAGDGKNYEMIWEYWTTNSRPDQYSAPWREIGQIIVAYSDYETNVAESINPSWSSGSEVNYGAKQYDNLTGRDYVATGDITAGDNTVRPSVAVQSDDVDLSTRWVDTGPANLFALLDDEISTKSQNDSTFEVTLLGEGYADRITLYGLELARDVEVIVDAGEMVPDPTFRSAGFAQWLLADATLSHANPGMIVTNTGTEAFAYLFFPGFYPGEEYTLSITATGTSWRAWKSDSDGTGYVQSSSASGTATRTITWTSGSEKQYVGILSSGGNNVTVTNFSIKQNGFIQQTLTADLEYGSTGNYRRRVKLSHAPVTAPKYDITLTAGAGETIKVGLITAGYAAAIGSTNANVRVGGEQKHAIIEDDYGATRFLKRVRKRQMDAVVWLQDATADGDYIDYIMSQLEGGPATYDFNNTGTNYERLLICGWASDWDTVVSGIKDNDYLNVTMKGLAE